MLGTAPVLAVKIDNTGPARPRVGLDHADLVYVEPVEGGLTRLLAVFATRMPPAVGPIRSAREADSTLLANVGRVAFAYSGSSAVTAAVIDKGRQVDVSMDAGPGGFRREPGRRAPYNVIGDPAALLARAGGSMPAGDIGLHVGAAPGGGLPGARVETAYPSARISLSWEPASGRYQVRTDGRPEVTPEGTPVGPASIFVQHITTRPSANRDVNGVATPLLHLVGSGAAQVVREGRVFEGTWSRGAEADPTRLTDAAGMELTFPPGPVWVLLIPDGQRVTVS